MNEGSMNNSNATKSWKTILKVLFLSEYQNLVQTLIIWFKVKQIETIGIC